MLQFFLLVFLGVISVEWYDPIPEEAVSVRDIDILVWNMSNPVGVQSSALSDIDRKWPNGNIPIFLHPSITREERSNITAAIKEIERKTCVVFEPAVASDQNFVLIFKPLNPNKCASFVGRKGGKQQLNLGINCYRQGVILHELIHVLGFIHEHSYDYLITTTIYSDRSDRDEYVTINWDNIEDGYKQNFKKRNCRIDPHGYCLLL